jgi:hypothetical protein
MKAKKKGKPKSQVKTKKKASIVLYLRPVSFQARSIKEIEKGQKKIEYVKKRCTSSKETLRP